MATKLIRLRDGTLVEVEVAPGEAQQISGDLADRVNSSFDQIESIVLNVCHSLSETWREVSDLVHLEKAEVEIGLTFEGEGHMFITKAKASANLVLTLTLTGKGTKAG